MGLVSLQGTFYAAILDTLEQQICVINQRGDILYVNRAWVEFGQRNGADVADWLKTNYLAVCDATGIYGDEQALTAVSGMRGVLDGDMPDFGFEYPCHSPDEERWFLMRMEPMIGHAGQLYVISHLNITQRKLAEAQTEFLSMHDPLTGLANRRHFGEFFRSEWNRNKRERTPVSLIMFDIDHFKELNDQLGHGVGDFYLSRVAHVIHEAARRVGDLAVRWGGEEFILLLGNTPVDAALTVAEDVRVRIEELPSVEGVKSTISAGVACVIPEGAVSDKLIAAADQALYHAKQSGRNRVVISE